MCAAADTNYQTLLYSTDTIKILPSSISRKKYLLLIKISVATDISPWADTSLQSSHSTSLLVYSIDSHGVHFTMNVSWHSTWPLWCMKPHLWAQSGNIRICWQTSIFVKCKWMLLWNYINSSPPSAAYMHQWIRSALVQIMACRLFSTKPLSEPMLGYCQLDPFEQA